MGASVDSTEIAPTQDLVKADVVVLNSFNERLMAGTVVQHLGI